MKLLIVIFVPILVYFGVGWIARDIYFSIVMQNGGIALQEVYSKEILVYNLVAAAYCLLLTIFFDAELGANLSWIPLAMYVLTLIIPASTGAAVLNAIVCIVVMMVSTASID